MLNFDPLPCDSRLLLVSNRLPITIQRSEAGDYEFSMSSGGLVTGLSGLAKATNFQWYGWPGLEVPEDEVEVVQQRLNDEFNATPVFMDEKLADGHYNGFSSVLLPVPTMVESFNSILDSILWPLLHYHPGEIVVDDAAWDAYRDANRLFAKTIGNEARDGDLIWVHDYHLMLLPEMLREELRKLGKKKKSRLAFSCTLHFPVARSTESSRRGLSYCAACCTAI